MNKFWKWILPEGLSAIVLLCINAALYGWLSPTNRASVADLDYRPSFEGTVLNDWVSLGGQWQLREGILSQVSATSQNAAAYAPPKLAPAQSYYFHTKIRVVAGGGAGLLFNVNYPRFFRKEHFAFVHSNEQQLVLNCGYSDQGITENQATIPLKLPPGFNAIDLGVTVDNNRYDVYVNGERVVQGLLLFYRGGLFGVGTSGGQAAFSDFAVQSWSAGQPIPLEPTTAPTTTPTETPPVQQTSPPVAGTQSATPGINNIPVLSAFSVLGVKGVSGTWIQVGNTMQQTAPKGEDYLATVEIPAEKYSISISIILGSGAAPNSGGGLIFNMLNPRDKYGANVVRFINGGQTLVWGYFANQEFIVQGQKEQKEQKDLNLTLAGKQTIKVSVGAKTYSVFANGTNVASDVPLLNNAGAYGLISDGGPVVFSDLELVLGEQNQ